MELLMERNPALLLSALLFAACASVSECEEPAKGAQE